MLVQIVNRLEKAKVPDVRQAMLLVFARIINSQPDPKLVFDFLSGISVGGTDGLSYPFFCL